MVLNTNNPRCPLCQETFDDSSEFEDHKTGQEHRVRWLMHWYQAQRHILASNKYGVEVHPEGDNVELIFDDAQGKVTLVVEPGGARNFDLVIKNSRDNSPIILRQIESLHATNMVRLSDDHDVTKNSKYVRILAGLEYAIHCKIDANMEGVEMVPFAFQFKSEEDSQLFFIVRTIEVVIADDIAKDAGPQTPYETCDYSGFSPSPHIANKEYFPGIPLEKIPSPDRPRIPLGQHYYSWNMHHIANANFNPSKVAPSGYGEALRIKNMQKEGLTRKNYEYWFKTMLWAEEMQMQKDIQYYSMRDTRLKTVPRSKYWREACVELEVLGLAEKRPSVLHGDSVFVTHHGTMKPVYEGVVHQANDKSLYLAFGPEFMEEFIDNIRVSVEFTFNRYPLRVSHRAVQLVQEFSLYYLTFPTEPRPPRQTVHRILPLNRKIEKNPQQMEAISNILAGTSKPAPYIIFGPPGTGKTVTVVETIKQVYKVHPNSVILAAAPSNAAVDLIAIRLLEHVAKHHILRLHARSRSYNTIPSELLEISNVDDKYVYMPTNEELSKCRILVCTFISASRVASASFPPGHITHVFLDECGHATEPEAMGALAGVVEHDTQVVLAGDPYQLGPVIRNVQCYSSGHFFKGNGLDKSYLERLMGEKMYQPVEGKYNTFVVTKLLNNYRSHSVILTQPNALFYNNELKACADPVLVHSLCTWEHLPKRNFPLIFHGVRGKDDREGNSPSFFNAIEVSTVIGYAKKLVDSRNPKILPKDIGIITPYRRQVEKIRIQLKKARLSENIKVGSPEEFQGDERRVIIISCVRASADQLASDQLFKLGFLRNPKRFNVAVTRAKALMIVIGCPEILQCDENWRKLMNYIKENGGYTGVKLLKETLDLDDILSRFDNLNLRPAVGEETKALDEVSAKEKAEGPEWRVEY